MQDRNTAIREVKIAKFNFAFDFGWQVGIIRQPSIVFNLWSFGENLIDAAHGGGSSLEEVNHPPQGDNRPGELHHVCVESHELPNRYAVLYHLAPSQP